MSDVASDRMGVSAFLTQDRIDIAQRFERHILLPIAEVYKVSRNICVLELISAGSKRDEHLLGS